MKINSLFILFFFVIATFFRSHQLLAQENGNDRVVIEEADHLFKNGKYVEAFPKYSQLLSLHPKDPFYTFRFGVCMMYFDTRETAKPIEQIKKTKDKLIGNDALEYYYFIGIALQQDYRFGEAAGDFDQFINLAGIKHPFYKDALQRKKMCESGLSLLKKMQSLYVLDKKQASQGTFFKSYSLKGLGRNISQRPDFVSSKIDKKNNIPSLVYFSDTNNVLYYSSLGKKGENGLDIFRVFKKDDGTWSSPEALGPEINTPFDENYPFVTPDGKNLYFCSKGHNSMGGYDIFRSTFDLEKKKWGVPENLDFPINSPFDDFMFVRDNSAKFAIFASNRNSKYGQLYVFTVRIDKKFEFDQNYRMEMLANKNIETSAEYDSLINMIKNTSLMEVNASNKEYNDTTETSFAIVTRKDIEKYKIPENPTEKDIVDIAFAQVSEAESNLDNFRNKRDAAQKLAEIRNTEAGKKNKEATEAYDQASYETDTKKKQELYSKATRLSAESEQLSADARAAGKIFDALDSVSNLQIKEIDKIQYKAGRVQQIAGQRQLDSSIVLLKSLIDNTDTFGIKLVEAEKHITGSSDLIEQLNNERDKLTQEIFKSEKNIKDFEEQAKQYKNEAALTNDIELKKEYQSESELNTEKARKEKEKIASLKFEAQKKDQEISEIRKSSKSYERINKDLDSLSNIPDQLASNNSINNNTGTGSKTQKPGDQETSVEKNISKGNNNTDELQPDNNQTQAENPNNKNKPDHNPENVLTHKADSANKTGKSISELKAQYTEIIKKANSDIDRTKQTNAYRFDIIKQKTELVESKEKEISGIDKTGTGKQKAETITEELTEIGLQLDVLQKQQLEGENQITQLESVRKTADIYMSQITKDNIDFYTKKSDSLNKLDIINPDKLVAQSIENDISVVNERLSETESSLSENKEAIVTKEKEYSDLKKSGEKGSKKKQEENRRKTEEIENKLQELRDEKVVLTEQSDSLRKLKQTAEKKIELNNELSESVNRASTSELAAANENFRKLSETRKNTIKQNAVEAANHANEISVSNQKEWIKSSEPVNQNVSQNYSNDQNKPGDIHTDINKKSLDLILNNKGENIPQSNTIEESQRLIQQAAYYNQAANMMAVRASSIMKLAAEENRELSIAEKREISALENLTKAYLQESSSMKDFAENQSKLQDKTIPEIKNEYTAKAFAEYQAEESKKLFAKADSLKKVSLSLPEGSTRNTILKEIEKTEELAWIRYFSSYDIYGAYNNTVFEASANTSTIEKIMQNGSGNSDKSDSLKAVVLMDEARKLRSEAFKTSDNNLKKNLSEKSLLKESEAIAYMQKFSGENDKISQRNAEYIGFFEKESGKTINDLVVSTTTGKKDNEIIKFYENGQVNLTENTPDNKNSNAKNPSDVSNANNAGNNITKPTDNLQSDKENQTGKVNNQNQDNNKENKISKTGNDSIPETIIAENGSKNDVPFYNIEKPIVINKKIGDELFYRVQFAASRKPVAEDKYKGIAPITAEQSEGWIRYMAGYFIHFTEALPSRDAIKNKGFADAFIVAYYKGKRISVFEARKIENEKNNKEGNQSNEYNTAINNKTSTDTGNKQLSTLTGFTYSIQVGVYGKPRNSDRLFGISPLFEERMNNGYYRYYAGSFADMASAISERNRIRATGVPDAFVVILYNGKKISQAEADKLIEGGTKPGVLVGGNSNTPVIREKPVFKIQIGAYSKEVPVEIVNAMIDMSGNKIERVPGENGTTIYLSGNYQSYDEAKKRKEELNEKGFPDAFVIAFSSGKKINLNEAIELSKQK